MYTVKVHSRIEKIITLFHSIGFWHEDDGSKFRKWMTTSWHLIVYGYYPLSLVGGALISDNDTEKMFMVAMSIVTALGTMRLFYFVANKDKILKLIRKIGVHTINGSEEEFHRVNGMVEVFIKFVSYFEALILAAVISLIIVALPIFSTEKRLPFNIFFPLDWQGNELYFWIAYLFVSYEVLMTVVCSLFSVIIWYLMMALVVEYDILGNELKNMGWINESMPKTHLTTADKYDRFSRTLILLIKKHRNLQEETMHFKLLFSNLFLIQMASSGLGICGSVFALAYGSATNPVEYVIQMISLFYCLFDIFMVTFFGNEIKLNSERLSYKLYESNWMDQTQTSKKCIFMLMEVLKRPQQLVIGIFPLDLEIFTKILNLAYRMFNVIRA